MNSSKNIKIIFVLSLLLTLSSCSVWQNFTTYFNLWYNIKTLFSDAEKDIQSQKKDLFSNEPLVLSNTARNNLTKVIEKCSELLQFHSNTAFVDDALLILGKSFYYQSNFQKAKRKFEELLATNPDEDLILEANLWIAKCDMQLKNYSQGLAGLKRVRDEALEKEIDFIIKDSFVEEIRYRIAQKELATAIELAKQFAEAADDDELKANIYFEVGNLYYQTDSYENAVEYYSKVFEYSPDIDTEIKASIRYGKALRESDKAEESVNFFSDLKKKDKFSESLAEIDLELGKSYSAIGDFTSSLEQLTKVDTTYKGSPFAALASLEIAKLYRDDLLNYDSAAAYFAKTIMNNPPKEYIDEAKTLNQLFIRYSNLRKTINNYDKQLFYAENPDVFIQDSVNYVQDSLQILQDYLAKKELADIWKAALTPALTDTTKKDTLFVRDSLFVQDSLAIVDSLSKVTTLVDTAEVNILLKTKIDLRIQQKKREADAKLSQEMQALMKTDTVKFKNDPPQRPKITIDSLKTLLAKNRLELGNLFFTEMNVPDSAKKLYEEITTKFSGTRYYPDALLALGSYYQTINENARADSLFRIIYDNYKDRPIANAAANKLGLPLIDLNYDPAAELYIDAESEMKNGNFDISFRKFYEIYKKHPQSQYASKGLYAAGFILENDLRLPDSAASVYDTLISKYPSSPYVKSVAMKVNTYKQEKARIEREKQAQLQQQQEKKDSTDVSELAFLGNKEDKEITEEEIKKQEQVAVNQDIRKEDTITQTKRKLERLWNPRKLRR
ncbi:TPR repeat-containing protein [Ignavibacterium album JCM 16511]|uniref:TPR repeat-containing protein n=1 Tax=Ignavibacterium album (strain DSM 19864 / JCM 16511 / NBRC 101810 / Mat9-16) TaxID=945713 RepID=I0ALX7_IGNAJ|nr:tetratricopeptide repeat protein [Ignavibacterium album]AFH49984.1 TPR repeat-containing protein [Ignavibacterium album JCM 16511]